MNNPYSSGDQVLESDLNQSLPITLTAGATIDGATLPVPIYMNIADEEVKACDADDADALEYMGFAVSNSTDGNDITIQTKGIVDGFTGLTVGELYYVQDAIGTIGLTPGTFKVLVGRAFSATQISIIQHDWKKEIELIASDNLKISADTLRSSSSATYEKVKEIKVKESGTYRIKFDLSRVLNDSGTAYGRIYKNDVAFGTEQSNAGGTSFITKSEDLVFSAGDSISIYLYKDGTGTSEVKNFRVYYDYDLVNVFGVVVID